MGGQGIDRVGLDWWLVLPVIAPPILISCAASSSTAGTNPGCSQQVEGEDRPASSPAANSNTHTSEETAVSRAWVCLRRWNSVANAVGSIHWSVTKDL